MFPWNNPQVGKIFLGVLALIPAVFFVTSVLRFKRTPPSYLAAGLFALLGLAIVGLEVLLIILLL